VGLGEGIAPPSVTNLLANYVPTAQRSRAVSIAFSGMNVGSVAGLILSPLLIVKFDWPVVFYVFGVLGIIWYAIWTQTKLPPRVDLSPVSPPPLVTMPSGISDGEFLPYAPLPSPKPRGKIPWAAFLSTPAVWAMIVAHFCGNWGYYIILTWLPTYLQSLGLSFSTASLLSTLPYVLMVFSGGLSGVIADYLVETGVNLTTVRKLMQSIATIGPAICLSALLTIPPTDTVLSIFWLSAALTLGSFSLAGLYCNHADIAPRYAGVLLGLTNTAGALPGILGVSLTGFLLDTFHSWNMIFGTLIVSYCISAVVWNLYATADRLFD